jgi:hypothetical protein
VCWEPCLSGDADLASASPDERRKKVEDGTNGEEIRRVDKGREDCVEWNISATVWNGMCQRVQRSGDSPLKHLFLQVFERWAESVCGIRAPSFPGSERGGVSLVGGAQGSRDKADPRSVRGNKGRLDRGIGRHDRLRDRDLDRVRDRERERDRDTRPPAPASSSSSSKKAVGRGVVLHSRAQRGRVFQELSESSWGTQAPASPREDARGRAPATPATPHSAASRMLYRDRYQDSWERVLARVPAVFEHEAAAMRSGQATWQAEGGGAVCIGNENGERKSGRCDSTEQSAGGGESGMVGGGENRVILGAAGSFHEQLC